MHPTFRSLLALGVVTGCAALRGDGAASRDLAPGILLAHLSPNGDSGDPAFLVLREAFRRGNPKADIEWFGATTRLAAAESPRVAFVQIGTGRGRVVGAEPNESDFGPGDAILLRPYDELELDAKAGLLVYTLDLPLPLDLPAFLRPDVDPRIDDQAGGCATEDNAYRRLLLTWKPENGPYVYHGLNAHRVRIKDSFTHYHPVDAGFDEFYLVQRTKDGARLLTSDRRAEIEGESDVSARDAGQLLHSHALAVDELIYIPRGVVHRGVGGAVVSVITVPGFRPGAEIGVDHHLRAIGERLSIAIPFNVDASKSAVVR